MSFKSSYMKPKLHNTKRYPHMTSAQQHQLITTHGQCSVTCITKWYIHKLNAPDYEYSRGTSVHSMIYTINDQEVPTCPHGIRLWMRQRYLRVLNTPQLVLSSIEVPHSHPGSSILVVVCYGHTRVGVEATLNAVSSNHPLLGGVAWLEGGDHQAFIWNLIIKCAASNYG